MRISAFLTVFLLTIGLLACGGAAEEGAEDTTAVDTTAMTEAPAGEMAGPAGALSTPSWMTLDETAQTVSMNIVAGESEANNRWNFNGLYAGEAADALDYLRSIAAGEETLSSDEWAVVQAGGAQLARGEYVTLDELRRQPSE